MFSPEEVLLDKGLVGAFDTMAMMHDEQLAIIFKSTDRNDNTSASCSYRSSSSQNQSEEMDENTAEHPQIDPEGVTYLELQISSQELAAHLYHRFGVRRGHAVAIFCHGHAAAEFVACLACARIGAPFVPIDSSWVSSNSGDKLAAILNDSKPVAAIVVAENDSDSSVKALASFGVYRCALISLDGSCVVSEANINDISQEIPPIYPDSDDESPEIRNVPLPPLFIMYTSGSTGVPKGVLGTHEALINRLVWQYKRFPYKMGGRSYGEDGSEGDEGEDGEDEGEEEEERGEDEEEDDEKEGEKDDGEKGEEKDDGDEEEEEEVEMVEYENLSEEEEEAWQNYNDVRNRKRDKRKRRGGENLDKAYIQFLEEEGIEDEEDEDDVGDNEEDYWGESKRGRKGGREGGRGGGNKLDESYRQFVKEEKVREKQQAEEKRKESEANREVEVLIVEEHLGIEEEEANGEMEVDNAEESDADSDESEGNKGENEEIPFRGEVVCRRTPLTFVDSMAEMFGPLLCGVPLWAPPPLFIRENGIAGIAIAAAAAGVTRLTLLPSQLSSAISMMPDLGTIWPCLSLVIVSGEDCDYSLAIRFRKALPGAPLLNITGSTEIGADVCYSVLCEPQTRTEPSDLSPKNAEKEILISENSGNTLKKGSDSSESPVNLNSSVNDENEHSFLGGMCALGLAGKAPIGFAIEGNELFIVRSVRSTKIGKSAIRRKRRRLISDEVAGTKLLKKTSGTEGIEMEGEEEENENEDENQQEVEGEGEEGDYEGEKEGDDEKNEGEEEFELVPDGTPGELLVGGKQLALGYHNRPGETKKRFILRSLIRGVDGGGVGGSCGVCGGEDNEGGDEDVNTTLKDVETAIFNINSTNSDVTADNRRVFRTGDIVMRIPTGGNMNGECRAKWEGALVWLGRSDLQVKVRGVRVELEEVERSIAAALQSEMDSGDEGEEGEEKVEKCKGEGDEAEDRGGSEKSVISIKDKVENSIIMIKEGIIRGSKEGRIRVKEHLAIIAIKDEDNRGHRLILFLENSLLPHIPPNTTQIRQILTQKCTSTYVPLLIFFIEKLPRTTTGKLDRQSLNKSANDAVSGDNYESGNENGNKDENEGKTGYKENKNDNYNETVINNHAAKSSSSRQEDPNDSKSNVIAGIMDKLFVVYQSVLPVAGFKMREKEMRDNEMREKERKEKEISVTAGVDHENENNGDKSSKSIGVGSNHYYGYDFYSLGGDSLKAVELMWKLQTFIRGIYNRLRVTDHAEGGEVNPPSNPNPITQPNSNHNLNPSPNTYSNLNSNRNTNTNSSTNSNASRLDSEAYGNMIEKKISSFNVSVLKMSIRDLANRIIAEYHDLHQHNNDNGGNNNDGNDGIDTNNIEMTTNRKRKLSLNIDKVSNKSKSSTTQNTNRRNDDENTNKEEMNISYEEDNRIKSFEQETKRLVKGSVYGRTGTWEWHPHGQEERNNTENTEFCPGIAPNVQSKLSTLSPLWSCRMEKCVDSSPLVIMRHYRGTESEGAVIGRNIADRGGDRGVGEREGGGSRQGLSGVEESKEDKGEQGGRDRNKPHPITCIGHLYIGSHGGDFTAIDILSGTIQWTLDLDSMWSGQGSSVGSDVELGSGSDRNQGPGSGLGLGVGSDVGSCDGSGVGLGQGLGRNPGPGSGPGSGRVHIEGSAASSLCGGVVYVGAFRGDDVDGDRPRSTAGNVNDGYKIHESEEDKGCLGRVFAIRALTGGVIWSTSFMGEIKGTIAVDHYRRLLLVGTYDGFLYLLSEESGCVVGRVPCGGSVYASPVLSGVCVGLPLWVGRGDQGVEGDSEGHNDEVKVSVGSHDNMKVDIDKNRNKNEECSTTIVSTNAFICTTQGSLIFLSLPATTNIIPNTIMRRSAHNFNAQSSEEAENNGENRIREKRIGENGIGDSAENTDFEVLWTYQAGAPIFSTPTVTTTFTTKRHTAQSEDSMQSMGIDIMRVDTVILGVVDGTLRCVSLRSTARVHVNSAGVVEVGGGMEGVGEVVGEEVWRISFASKPVFSSICCINKYATIKEFHFYSPRSFSVASSSNDSENMLPNRYLCESITSNTLNTTSNEQSSPTEDCSSSSTAKESSCLKKESSEHFTDNVIVFGSHDGFLRGVSVCGELLWKVDLGSVLFASPCAVGRLVVAATTAGGVYLVDSGGENNRDGGGGSGGGDEKERNSGMESSVNSENDSNNNVSNVNNVENVTNFDDVHNTKNRNKNGAIIAHTRLNGEIYSSPLVCGNNIFIGCRDDRVHAIQINCT